MKSSNRFSDYIVSSSITRSITNSPTSGIIHRQCNSYGPRLTLLNKSRSHLDENKTKHQQQSKQTHGYIQKILLLSLQVSRLSSLNQGLVKEIDLSKNNVSKELFLLRQTNEKLKINLKTYQLQLMKVQQQKTKMEMTYQSRINQLQLQVKKYSQDLRETQKLLENIKEEKQQLQFQKEKFKGKQNKQGMNPSGKIYYQKPINLQNQKIQQISLFKQNKSNIKPNINEHKNTITPFKQYKNQPSNNCNQLFIFSKYNCSEFDKMKRTNNHQLISKFITENMQSTEIMSRYDEVTLQFKELRQKVSLLQEQLHSKHKQTSQKDKEIQQKQRQLIQQKLTIQELKQINMNFINKHKLLQDRLRQISNEIRVRQHQQEKKLNQLQLNFNFLIGRKQREIQTLNQEIKKLTTQNEGFRKKIQKQQEIMKLKTLEVSNNSQQLRQTQRILRKIDRLSKTRKDSQNIYLFNHNNQYPESKLLKSRSIDSTSLMSHRKGIDISLESIISDASVLQDSNQRCWRLINRSQEKLVNSFISPIKCNRKVLVKPNEDGIVNRDCNRQNSIKRSDIGLSEESRTLNNISHQRKYQNYLKSSLDQYYSCGVR